MSTKTQLWTDTFLDAQRLRADPLADAVMEQVIAAEGEAEARRLFDLLIRRIELPLAELPPLIQDFITQTNQLPAWAD